MKRGSIAYAEKIFPDMSRRLALRRIRRAGGAEKLQGLSEEASNLLLGLGPKHVKGKYPRSTGNIDKLTRTSSEFYGS
jgi:hypothetical protein